MIINDLTEKLGYKPLNDGYDGNRTVSGGFTSDLLSDVMGNAPDEGVLITIQSHKNTVAVASLTGLNAIVLCSGRAAPDDMIEAACEEEIAVFQSSENQFQVSWKIHELLNE